MNQNLGKILRSSPVGGDVSGIFVISYLRILVRHLPLDLNVYINPYRSCKSWRVEKELFSDDISESTQSNLSAEEFKALRGLAADKTIVIKAADKGSSVAVWDKSDYLHEA